MHIFIAADTFPEKWETFEQWLSDLRFKNKGQHAVYAREIRVYDIWFKKEAEEEILAHLRGLEADWGRNRFKGLVKFISRLFLKKPKKSETIMSDYEDRVSMGKNRIVTDNFLAHVIVLGKLEDYKCKKTGREIT